MDVTTNFLHDRSKLWTPSIEKLLRKWRKQICIRQKGHLKEERVCLKKYQLISLPSILISSVVSTAIFSTFEDCPPVTIDENGAGVSPNTCEKKWIRLTSGILNMIGVAFLGINSFFNFQEKASKHKTSSDAYNELLRLIDSTLGTPTQFRGDAVAILQHIKSRYDDIIKQSESLSEDSNAELEYMIKKDGSETSSDKNNDYETSHDLIHRELSEKFKKKETQSPTEETRQLRESLGVLDSGDGDITSGDSLEIRENREKREPRVPSVPRVPSITGLDKIRRDSILIPKDMPRLEVVSFDKDDVSEVHLSFDPDEIAPPTRTTSIGFYY